MSPAAFTPIAGNLPWDQAGGGAGTFQAAAGSDPVGQQIGQQYSNAYNSALAMNQANYQNILAGYQQTQQQQQTANEAIGRGYGQLAGDIQRLSESNLAGQNQATGAMMGGFNALSGQQTQGYGGLAQQQAQGYQGLGNTVQQALDPMRGALTQQQQAQGRIQTGYGNLSADVLGGIANIGTARSQAIADTYAQQRGKLAQSLISSGLGNTTVQGAMQRGVSFDAAKAQNDLAEQIAQLQAGYKSNLGLAGLGYANQAVQQNTAQSNLIGQNQADYAARLGQAGLASQSQIGQAGLQSASQLGQAQLGAHERAIQMNLNQQNLSAQQQQQIRLGQLGFQSQAAQAAAQQANQQLGWMNTVNAPYPDASQYGNLLAQRGAALQADATRQTMAQLYQQQLDAQRNLQQQALSQPQAGTWTQGSIGGGGGQLPAFNPGQPGYPGANYPSAGLSPRATPPLQGPGQGSPWSPDIQFQDLGQITPSEMKPEDSLANYGRWGRATGQPSAWDFGPASDSSWLNQPSYPGLGGMLGF